MSYFEQTSFKDSLQMSSFGALNVSQKVVLFDDKLPYGKSGLFWSEKEIAGGTSVHDETNSCVDMTVTNSGDIVVRQTRQRWKYQAGHGQEITMTTVMEPQSGTRKHVGYFQTAITGTHEPHDGVCFESIDLDMYVTVFKNGSVTDRIKQTDWNIDKMDSTGPSGVTVDWSKTQIIAMDIQWLGAGRVRYWLNIGGCNLLVHEANHANLLEQVYMRSGTQPLCYRIESTGGAGTLKEICVAVQSQGGSTPTGVVASLDMGITPLVDVAQNLVPLIGIRLKSAERDTIVEIINTSIISLDKSDMRWVLAFNPTIDEVTDPLVWTPQFGSPLEVCYGTLTNHVTTAVVPDFSYESDKTRGASEASKGNLNLGTDIEGIPDNMFLCAQNIKAITADMIAGIQVRQLV